MKSEIRNPLVTVDWNFIQTLPLDKCILPSQWELIVPDEVTNEILDKPVAERRSASAFLEKFVLFCRKHQDRIWLGFTPGVVCSRHPRGGVKRRHLFHGSLSLRLRRLRSDSNFSMDGFIAKARASDAHKKYSAANATFDALTSDFRAWMNQRLPSERPRFDDRQWLLDFIRDPNLLQGFTHKEVLDLRKIPQHELLVFPDRSPYGVWSRLVVWYSCRRASLHIGSPADNSFSNSYADASCAFHGRFTGHLLTDDRGLHAAAEAVAPGIRLYKWSPNESRVVRAEILGEHKRDMRHSANK